ncbi:pentatricopeptide repeat-containing protein At4g02750-like [Aristolochia californica]|uniref:pentatricopeptide repeat-containing protein At4g02750-like n=1 Tax=Aristolochia californica TaxID=171875 RepID=UPI0035E2CEC8
MQRLFSLVDHSSHRLYRAVSTSALPIIQNPDINLFSCTRQIKELSKLGRIDEARRVFDDMIQRDTFSWNAMITGYAQNGHIDEARVLFDAFLGKDVRSWTTMITGYAKLGLVDEARLLFGQMPVRNIISWNAMISGYVENGDIISARNLFDEMPERDVASWNTILRWYCHSYQMIDACHLFDKMTEKNLVSWSTMIAGYTNNSEYEKAWQIFREMRQNQVLVDQFVLVVTLTAVTNLNDSNLVDTLQTLAIKTSFVKDVVVGTAFLNAYARNGLIDYVKKFFKTMTDRNDFTWSTMISTLSQSGKMNEAIALYETIPDKTVNTQTAMLTSYGQHGKVNEARYLFDQISNPNMIAWNAMLTGYMQNCMVKEAWEFFRRMPNHNAVSWAAMISGFAQSGMNEEALKFFSELHQLEYAPSHSCLTSAIFACTNISSFEMGTQIHAVAIKTAAAFNSFVGNALITMYAKCRKTEDVSRAFSTVRLKDVVSWNSLVAGLSLNYLLDDATNVFRKMPKKDVVSWTSIISAYVQGGHEHKAFELFVEMLSTATIPNSSTIASLLSACASMGSARLGRQIHGFAFNLGLDSVLFVGNSLINMYFKCGSLDAFKVFDEMFDRDIVTWNTVLSGAAQQGFGKEAVEIFEQMMADGVLPNQASFIGLLCACSHAGLVEEGWNYFISMSRHFGLEPMEPHYACMVDLLGRAGRLYEAEELIERMPIEPDSVVFAALLAACRIHKNVDLGRKVAEKLFQMDPQNAGNYILLSNIYASLGMWEKVGEIRKVMKERGVTKEPGCSWIQMRNKVHTFITGDRMHEQTEQIHSKLKELFCQLQATGYVPDANFVLHDVEEEQKESVLLYHSEKLALAFGLLNTPKGAPLQIMKNLRICGDCHNFAKFLSDITSRKIVIRDGNRFHHFSNGICSCGDYW